MDPEQLADTKLKCVFELPGGAGSGEQRFAGDKSSECFIPYILNPLIKYLSLDANDSTGSDKEPVLAPVAAPIPVREEPKELFDKSTDNELRKARNENSSLKQENIKLQVIIYIYNAFLVLVYSYSLFYNN